jgi:hypothetical protein
MCVGIPGRVIERFREHGILMGKVDFGGVTKRVYLEHVENAAPGASMSSFTSASRWRASTKRRRGASSTFSRA